MHILTTIQKIHSALGRTATRVRIDCRKKNIYTYMYTIFVHVRSNCSNDSLLPWMLMCKEVNMSDAISVRVLTVISALLLQLIALLAVSAISSGDVSLRV